MIMRFDARMEASFSTMPPGCCGPLGLLCLLTKLILSMMIASLSGSTRSTLPVLPRSFPVITMTLSFLRICTLFSRSSLEHFRRQGNNFQKFLRPQLARHRAENARANGFLLIVDQNGGVIIEADVGSVRPSYLLCRSNYYRFGYFTLFYLGVRDRFFYGYHNDVADRSILPFAAAQHLDALDFARAGIIR